MEVKNHRHEHHYKAEVNVTGALAGGGMQSIYIELARTQEVFDAENNYVPDPLVNVIRRGADVLEEKLANGEIGALDISSFSVMKIASRSVTQEMIGQAEESAGIPRSL
jgi:hypothetical protein